MQLTHIWKQKGQNIEAEGTGDVIGFIESISLSNDGKRFIIGAPRNDSDTGDTNDNRGHARIFEWNGLQWEQIGQDIDGENSGEWSGRGSAISGNGNRVAIGSIYSNNNKGKVRVFEYNGTNWEQIGENFIGNSDDDRLGFDVSLSYDGNIVSFSAHYNLSNAYKGLVYVYKWNGTEWEKLGQDLEGDFFAERMGYNTSLSDDGKRLCIKSVGNGGNFGKTQVFEYNGTEWVQLGSNIDNLIAGRNISDLSGDGNSLIVSTPDYENKKGIARVFRWDGSEWIQLGNNFIGENDNDLLGYDSKISYNGQRIVIGIDYFSSDNLSNNGKLIVYDWNGTSWEEVGNSIYGISDSMFTGGSVEISGDGNTILDGGYGFNNFTGLSRIFEYTKIISSLTEEIIYLEPNEEIGGSSRNKYFNSLKPFLDLSKKIIVPSSSFNENLLNRKLTEVIFSSESSSYTPSVDNDVYVIMENDNDEITFLLENENTLRIVRDSETQYSVYENGSETPSYNQTTGDSGLFEGFEWKVGSLFGSLLPNDIICFASNEVVHTDQGDVLIKDIKEGEHSIRGMTIKKLSKNRCKRSKMVLIQKDAFGPNVPNKDTKISLDHKIFYGGKMRPVHRLLHKNGLSLIESRKQVVYNIMLSNYSWMKVNNMVAETLYPK